MHIYLKVKTEDHLLPFSTAYKKLRQLICDELHSYRVLIVINSSILFRFREISLSSAT